jgi:hypothetical protein
MLVIVKKLQIIRNFLSSLGSGTRQKLFTNYNV